MDTSNETTSPELFSSEPIKRVAAAVGFVIKMASTSIAQRPQRMLFPLTSSTSFQVLFENETAMGALSPALQAQFDSILSSVRDEIIEDGMMNTIGRKLPDLIATHYREVLPAIAALTDSHRASAVVISEVLKEIGRIRDPRSHIDRRWILEHALSSENPAARDGAAVGLAWLGDPSSARYLRAAADTELIPQLKADLDEVFRLLVAAADQNGAAPEDQQT